MALIASYLGKDEVLSAFEKKAKVPYFSIWDGTRVIVQYNEDDFEEAKEIISDEFDLRVKRNYTNVCVLKLHPEKEKVYSTKSTTVANLYFTWLDNQPVHIDNTNVNAILLNEINSLKAELNALKMKQDDEEDEDEEDEEEDDKGMSYINGIKDIMDHPLVAGLVNGLMSGRGQRVNNLAGTEGDIDECIQTLFKKGVTIEHLRKLAEMPTAKIQMLLSML